MKKEQTFEQGKETLLELRHELMETLYHMKEELDAKDFYAMPFPKANGYHSKTIAYSIWHIFRIEDIVVHTFMKKDEQIFFAGNYQERTGSAIITTANELAGEQIVDFSRGLDIEELYQYAAEVQNSTEEYLKTLPYQELKRKMTGSDRENVQSLQVVSTDEKASWLIDYWCKKDVRGLIQMPLSRHWIMHVEASLRIRDKICQKQNSAIFLNDKM